MRVPNIKKLNKYDFDNRMYETRCIGKVEPIVHKERFEFLDEKAKQKFIGKIEKIIRKSIEYKNFIKFLKDELDMEECTFFSKLKEKCKNIKIEIHHEPFCLYDLVHICINMFMEYRYSLNEFAIAEEVMKWHYMGLIGLIPLSSTVHGLVHDGELFIPINYPFGDIKGFYEEFSPYMTENHREMFATIIERSVHYKNILPDVLKKRYVYLNVDGFELPQNI